MSLMFSSKVKRELCNNKVQRKDQENSKHEQQTKKKEKEQNQNDCNAAYAMDVIENNCILP